MRKNYRKKKKEWWLQQIVGRTEAVSNYLCFLSWITTSKANGQSGCRKEHPKHDNKRAKLAVRRRSSQARCNQKWIGSPTAYFHLLPCYSSMVRLLPWRCPTELAGQHRRQSQAVFLTRSVFPIFLGVDHSGNSREEETGNWRGEGGPTCKDTEEGLKSKMGSK